MATVFPLVAGGKAHFHSQGNPLQGGLVYFYITGTSTPKTTYSESTGTTANTNPVVLDSRGEASIYLLGDEAYKMVVNTSADVLVDSRDPVYGLVDVLGAPLIHAGAVCEGRATLTSGTPVTTSDVTAATSIYFTPFKGNRIMLYDGTRDIVVSFTEKTLAVPATTNQMYDVWGYLSSGTLALEALAWTNDTTRATALTTRNGYYVKTGDATRRYLFSFRTTGVSGQTEDSAAKRYLWNYYNRAPRFMKVTDSTDSWAYTTATFRQANANTANQLDFVIGVSEDTLVAEVLGIASSTGDISIAVGIGVDSTSTNSAILMGAGDTIAGENMLLTAKYRGYPGVGRHYLAWLEWSTASGTTTWRGDNGLPGMVQAGIMGEYFA